MREAGAKLSGEQVKDGLRWEDLGSANRNDGVTVPETVKKVGGTDSEPGFGHVSAGARRASLWVLSKDLDV